MCSGVASEPTWATYETEKSWFSRAYHMTAEAPTMATANSSARRLVRRSPAAERLTPAM